LADKLGKERIKLMIKEKKSKEPLLTKKVVGTEEFNIKPTLTGTAGGPGPPSNPLEGRGQRVNLGFSSGTDRFFKQLKKIKFPQESYIDIAKRVAKREGYDPEKLSFANNNDNKLKYEAPDGVKYFGKAGYGDYIIWLFKERNKHVPVGYADKKRNTFRKSHGAMTKKYKLGKFSPNELAVNILW